MNRVFVSVTNDCVNDQRVHKVCSSLCAEGWQVELIGRRSEINVQIEREYNVHRFPMWFRRGALFYTEFNIRLFFYLLTRPSGVLHSNDLDTLLASQLVARIRRCALVHDAHEYFTEVPELQNRPLIKGIWKRIERLSFPRIDHLFTVNDSIAWLYKEVHGKHAQVIRNIPVKKATTAAQGKEALGFSSEDFLMINQGTGINVDRGMEELFVAMTELPERMKLLLVGKGDVLPKLHSLRTKLKLQERIKIMDTRPYGELMRITASCDLGLSLDKDNNLNYRFSLPNKLFDYIRAGIPILSTDLPEVGRIVRGKEVGHTIAECSPEAIVQGIREMEKKGKVPFKNALALASSELNWETEVEPMLACYRKLSG